MALTAQQREDWNRHVEWLRTFPKEQWSWDTALKDAVDKHLTDLEKEITRLQLVVDAVEQMVPEDGSREYESEDITDVFRAMKAYRIATGKLAVPPESP